MNLSKLKVKYEPTTELIYIDEQVLRAAGVSDGMIGKIQKEVSSLKLPEFIFGKRFDLEFYSNMRFAALVFAAFASLSSAILISGGFASPADLAMKIEMVFSYIGVVIFSVLMLRFNGRSKILDVLSDGIIVVPSDNIVTGPSNASQKAWQLLRRSQLLHEDCLKKTHPGEFKAILKQTELLRPKVIRLTRAFQLVTSNSLEMDEVDGNWKSREVEVATHLLDLEKEMQGLLKNDRLLGVKATLTKDEQIKELTRVPELNAWSFSGLETPDQELVNQDSLK